MIDAFRGLGVFLDWLLFAGVLAAPAIFFIYFIINELKTPSKRREFFDEFKTKPLLCTFIAVFVLSIVGFSGGMAVEASGFETVFSFSIKRAWQWCGLAALACFVIMIIFNL